MSFIDKQVSCSASNAGNEHVSTQVSAAVTVPALEAKAEDASRFTLLISTADDLNDHASTPKKQRKSISLINGEPKAGDIYPATYFAARELGPHNGLPDFFDTLKREVLDHPSAPFDSLMRGTFMDHDAIVAKEAERIATVAKWEAEGRPITKDLEKPYFRTDAKNGRHHYRHLDRLIHDTPRHWVCMDFDNFRPESMTDARFPVDHPRPWVDAAIAQELGEDFEGVSYILHLSSKAGLPKEELRAHVFFWMAQPMDKAAWDAWFDRRTAELRGEPNADPERKPKVDARLFLKGQFHYIADPLFKEGATDPVAALGAPRWQYVQGDFGNVVTLTNFAEIEAAAVAPRAKAAARGSLSLEREDDNVAREAWSKDGPWGAFNRAFTMSETIKRFLPNHLRIDTAGGRTTWLNSPSGSNQSCWIISNARLCSTSATIGLNAGFAADWVQYLLFDNDPGAFAEWARSLPEVQAEMDRVMPEDFDGIDVVVAPIVPLSDAEHAAAVAAVEAESKKKADVKADMVAMAARLAVEYAMPKGAFGPKQRYAPNRNKKGLWFGFDVEFKHESSDEKVIEFVPLWSPITLLTAGEDEETGKFTISLKLRVGGRDKIVTVDRGELSKPGCVSEKLFQQGWCVADLPHGMDKKDPPEARFIKYLKGCAEGTEKNKTVLSRPGWRSKNPEAPVFGCPGGQIAGKDGDLEFAMKPEHIVKKPIGGDLAAWQETAKAAAASGVQHYALGVAMGFAGPLLNLAGQTGGVVLTGLSSKGKTTAGRIAASVWSHPQEGTERNGVFHSLRGTSTGLENLAALGNGSFCGLDEVALADESIKRNLESTLYGFSGGTGKSRGQRDGSLSDRPVAVFRTFFFVTMEPRLDDFILKHTGAYPQPGLSVRFPSVNVDDQPKEIADVSKVINSGIEANFGHAGPAFVAELIARGYAGPRRGELLDRHGATVKSLVTTKDSMESRAAGVFAWIALGAELAIEFGIVPSECAEPLAASVRWALSRTAADGEFVTAEAKAVEHLREFIVNRWDSLIIPYGAKASAGGTAKGFYEDGA